MLRALPVEEWLSIQTPVLDVRSPGEFLRGHIPGAHSLPLFSNEERAVVGTIYKQVGRDQAVLEGLRLIGPKLAWFVEEAKRIAPAGRVRVHCWRGGERSGSMGWLLDKAGFAEVHTLKRGYKGFRSYAGTTFSAQLPLRVLGGYTGSGKTEVLQRLKEAGQQVIDLEALAAHKGSAFGALGEPEQPTTEHFENLLWSELNALDKGRPIWVEDESLMIGRIQLPKAFYTAMRQATMYFVDLPRVARIDRLVGLYGNYPAELLSVAIQRIAKRLGPQHCKAALEALQVGDLHTVVGIVLRYYDKAYDHGASTRDPRQVISLPIDPLDFHGLPELLIAHDERSH